MIGINSTVKIIIPDNLSELPAPRIETIQKYVGELGRVTRVRDVGIWVRFGVFGDPMYFFLNNCVEVINAIALKN